MSIDDQGKPSIDDAIMDFLSKKSIVDLTEKLALARISGKLEISSEQADLGIKGLCAKNLVRKVYFQGKVGFELTPRGRSAIEALAKAETERITRQLQESIHQERIAKLRSSAVDKLISVEEEWRNIQIPDRKLIDEVEHAGAKFLASTKAIEANQPLCYKTPINYDQEFQAYKPQVEKLVEENIKLARSVNEYVKIKNLLTSMSSDVESFNKAIKKYESILEAAVQVSELKTSLSKLKSIQCQLESFDLDQLSRFEALKTQLSDNFRLLEGLKKPTHEFVPIKKESVVESAALVPDPECPIKYGRKSDPLVEKCGKCGVKRKSSPVNIG